MSGNERPSAWRSAALLAAVALAAVAALGALHLATRSRIEAQVRRAELDALAVVLPAAGYDNDPLADSVRVLAPRWLGSDAALRVWRARRGAAPSALVLEAVAPDGYAGPIRLLVGIHVDGRVSGVRVTAHRETPGLGDPIERERSDWIDRLAGRALGDPPADAWTVRRDGGAFDQFAGATVTPRAVLHAVRRALEYVRRHGAELQAAPAGVTLEHPDGPD